MSDIFISYAREDRERVKVMAEALQRLGWSVWWDRTIPAGKSFAKVIQQAIADAKCIVVVWSHYSIESDWVQDEAREGLKKGILIPVLKDDVEPPLGFRGVQAADLTSMNETEMSPEFEKFVSDITLVIGLPPKSIDEVCHEAETEARQRAEKERQQAEAEIRRKAEEERQRAEAEANLSAEGERQRVDAEAGRKAEQERQRAEGEIRRKAEEERRRLARKRRVRIIGAIIAILAIIAIINHEKKSVLEGDSPVRSSCAENSPKETERKSPI